jgi:hypothetical protein
MLYSNRRNALDNFGGHRDPLRAWKPSKNSDATAEVKTVAPRTVPEKNR